MSASIKASADGLSGSLQVGGVDVVSFGQGIAQGNKNKIINGAFDVNQRAYVSGAATTVGQYTLDRWKVTATNGITFSTTANKTTVTIPSGQTIQQVIKGSNLRTGTYVLSWEGTAQGRIAGGSYGASGSVTASITGGTNTTIEFNTGTVTNVQLEIGMVATPFEHRLNELDLCLPYYEEGIAFGATINGALFSTGAEAIGYTPFRALKITTPTITTEDLAGNVGKFSNLYSSVHNQSVSGGALVAAQETSQGFVTDIYSSGSGLNNYKFRYKASAEL